MNPSRVLYSVVTRLVACMVIGGLVLSASMALLGRARIEAAAGMDLTRDMTETARNIQSLTCGPLASASPQELRQALEVLTCDADIRGARLTIPTLAAMQVGDAAAFAPSDAEWYLPERAVPSAVEVNLRRPTLLRAPFLRGLGRTVA